MSLPPFVSIHILNYNGGEEVLRCLRSVSQLTYPNFGILVIDNASTDDSLGRIEAEFPQATVLRNTTNLGFGGGHNVGIQSVLTHNVPYIWLLNQDTAVAPDSLDQLIETARTHPSLGALSPVVLRVDDTAWFEGGRIDWLRMRALHTPVCHPKDPEYLSGCALFIKTEALKRSGFFDERFFLYYEDADLSLRIQRAGFRLFVEPKSKIWHTEASNRNVSTKTLWLVWSGLLFFQKHASEKPLLTRLWLSCFFWFRVAYNQIRIFLSPSSRQRRALARLYFSFASHYGRLPFLFHSRQLPEHPPHPTMAQFFGSDQSRVR